uniref:Rho-GAP domain-containing protein n=1 Tax=Mesocestoides corti TaxID=53468 RepID=A0A5K3EU57_MESCO
MPVDNANRNFERNRENRARHRRFKGTNVESMHEGASRASGVHRRSRIDMPTRGAKSMSNLASIDKENSTEPTNNVAAGLTAFTRLFKWWRHPSSSRETPPGTTTHGKVSDIEPRISPTRYHQQPPPQQSTHISKKKDCLGYLGLGEYVDSMGGGFEDPDVTGGSPQPQGKSRSLIDISMSNLWGTEDEETDEAGQSGSSGPEESRKSSSTSERRPTLLSSIARLIPYPPTAPNLVQFMDSPETSTELYENMETTFFGNSEERWSMPALVITTCAHMQRGDMFNIHCVSDYMAELKLTANWAKNMRNLCDAELRRYKSAGISKHQRRLTVPSLAGKAENELELRDLCSDFAAFLDGFDTFLAQTKEDLRGAPISAILVAGHNEKLLSMKNLFPVTMSFTTAETPKLSYRKLVCEAAVTATISLAGKAQETHTELLSFLFNDSIILAKCRSKKTSVTGKWATKSSLLKQTATFETLVRLPLLFLGIQPQVETGVDAAAKVTPNPCSSSSGISSATSTEEDMDPSENGSASGIEDAAFVIGFWWPLGNRCQLNFGDARAWISWKTWFYSTMEQLQGSFTNLTFPVKVQNDVAPKKVGLSQVNFKCVHKYLPIGASITARKLKEKALASWNVACQLEETEIFATFTEPIKGTMEIPLSDDDRPFLLVLYIAAITGDKVSPSNESLDLSSPDQVEQTVTLRTLNSSLSPDRIPVAFIIRNSNSKQPKLVVDQDVFEPLKLLFDPPKSNVSLDANRNHRHPLKTGLSLSQSTHNLGAAELKEEQKGRGGVAGGGKGRSRSRLRLHLSRNNLSSTDNTFDDTPSPQFGIFGRLPKEAWPDCRVSMSVMSLFVLVFYKGSLTEGIFRKSVQKSQLHAMIQRVDTDENPLLVDECSPLYAANILKKYFSEIPGHLLIDEKWDDWCKMTTLKSDEEIANYAKKMMRELPDINQSLLTFLLFTLAQIRVNQEVNKMSVDALSTVWGPNLLERPNAQPSVEDSNMCASIASCLLGQFTDIYCLNSTEFRQKLSSFFDEIWGQMNPPNEPKPAPEGLSILELPENKADDVSVSDTNTTASPRIMEPLLAKDKRNSLITHSLSQDESPEVNVGFRRYLKTLKKDSKSCSSQESAELPPPVPPRSRRKSTSNSSGGSVSQDSEVPPPLPARTYGSPTQFFSPREQRKKMTIPHKENLQVSGTTVVDRRRSFSRRRNPSRSPVRSCTIEMTGEGRRTFMIGDFYNSFAGMSLDSDPVSNLKSPLIETKLSYPTLYRSTSDVDAHPLNKMQAIQGKQVDSPNSEFEMIGQQNETGAWNTMEPLRTTSRNYRCETRWTCGLYSDANTVEREEDSTPKDLWIPKILRPHLEALPSSTGRTTGVRPRPTAIYVEDKSQLFVPVLSRPATIDDVPAGICRRISSLYEQKRASECSSKNWSLRLPLMSFDQLTTSSGGSTHLSRGSSHASTGSSTSTTVGQN